MARGARPSMPAQGRVGDIASRAGSLLRRHDVYKWSLPFADCKMDTSPNEQPGRWQAMMRRYNGDRYGISGAVVSAGRHRSVISERLGRGGGADCCHTHEYGGFEFIRIFCTWGLPVLKLSVVSLCGRVGCWLWNTFASVSSRSVFRGFCIACIAGSTLQIKQANTVGQYGSPILWKLLRVYRNPCGDPKERASTVHHS